LENVLLTQEEIEKRNELFEYEMTQVILNLKGKYTSNDNVSSPIKDFELAEGDVDKRLDFIPLSKTEIEMQLQDIPAVCIGAGFTPLADVKPVIRLENDVQNLLLAKHNANFTPLAVTEFKTAAQGVPKTNMNIEFNPVQAAASISTQEIPESISINQYTPYTGMDVAGLSVVIPATDISCDYVPVSSDTLEVLAQDIPMANVKAVFAPLSLKAVTESVGVVPAIGKLPAFSPVVPPMDTSMKLKTPAIRNSLEFKPLDVQVEFQDIESPAVSSIADLSPIDMPLVNPLGVTIPSMTSIISYIPTKGTVEALLQIDIPHVGDTVEYVPVSDLIVLKTAMPVPKHDVSILHSSEFNIDTSAIGPIDSFQAEDIAPKDFYTMWLNAE